MTLSPKKYVSNFTSSTTNRGVEAKEIEIANTRLDVHASSRSAAPLPLARRSPPPPPPPPCAHAHHTHAHTRTPLHAPLDVLAEPDDTASYIQVEVRRARRSTRLPAASSPAPAPAPQPTSPAPAPAHNSCMRTMEMMDATGLTGTGDVVMMPAMMTCAASTWQGAAGGYAGGGVDAAAAGDAAHDTARCGQQRPDDASEKNVGLSIWRKMSGVIDGNDDSDEDGRPERMEVYYFERGCATWLATSDAAHEAALERLARRAARRGRAWLDEAWAVPRLVLAAPLAALLGAERSALLVARGAAVGVVQTAADYALKPALALTFNALVHPPLVFAGNVCRAVRDALRPLWGALGDALEPLARLLASVRIVHVHIERRCSCANTAV